MSPSTYLQSSADDSGLMHLMEAATALTQLVSAPAASSSFASPLSRSPVHVREGTIFPIPISDDDDTMPSSANMTLLRENHLQALRAATLAAVTTRSAEDEVPITDETAISQQKTATATTAPSKDKDIFPMRLHALLEDPTVRDVISWLPHGRSFVILRPDLFATRVLPLYFDPEGSNSPNARRSSNGRGKNQHGSVHKYPSFTRKLNRWGFRQISRGADAGAFCHELFLRDDPEACRSMACQKSRKTIKDDCKSISSTSTTSGMSGLKRSSTTAVTVSISGTSSRSLPFKKRRGVSSSSNYVTGIPSNVEMKSNKSSLLAKNTYVNSDTETVSNLSLDGSNCSPNQLKAPSYAPTANASNAPFAVQLSAEVFAKEALIRHFHAQHRAFALASLMENSRLALLARDMDVESSDNAKGTSSPATATNQPRESLGATAHSSVFAPTVTVTESYSSLAAQHSASAEAAKIALYEAYKKALSRSS